MDARDRERIEALFEAALERSAHERAAWLRAAVSDDERLEAEVLALLAAHDHADGLLDRDAGALAQALVEDDPQHRRIGPYRVLRELGRGGMGVVYLAERDDGQYRRRVAIKLLGRGGDAEELHRRFLAERQILASLDHPNIAQLLDGGVTDGLLPYLVMEYVEGLPITEYCDRHRLDVSERLRLFQHACAAVHHAHQNLVIHRDLKPSNILVTASGQVKLLDFGIAKLLNPGLSAYSPPVTRTQFRMLTPEFASPEQLRGDPLSTASDVYSLGVLLYELLTGRSPYRVTHRGGADLLAAIGDQEPQRPSTRAVAPESVSVEGRATAEISPGSVASARDTTPERLRRRLRGDLDAIVLMALRKEAGRRYGSAALLAQDIERHLEGQPVLAHRGSRAYRAAKLVRRHTVESVAAGLVAAALVAGAVVSLWQSRIAEREHARATEALAQAELALDQSREVTDFLMAMFTASDPASARGDQITARELLERGVARSDALAGRPLLQAQMLEVVGRVYGSLGRYPRARELLERSLAIRRSELGGDHADLATTLHALANVLAQEGRYREAEPLHREALAMRGRIFGPDDPIVGQSLNALGLLLHLRGDMDGAEAAYLQALDLERRALGEEHPDVLWTESRLAVLLRDRGDLEAADTMLLRTVRLKRRVLGDVHPELAAVLLQLGVVRSMRDDTVGADSLFHQTVAMRRQLYGDDHPAVAAGLLQMAITLGERGEHARAEALYDQVLDIQRRLLGSEHPQVGNTLNSLGVLRRQRGDMPGAERLFRDALAVIRQAFDGDHASAAHPMENLAELLLETGRPTEAEALARETLALRERLLGKDHPFVARSAQRLAGLLQRQGRHLEAEPLYLRALQIHQDWHNTRHAEEVRAELAALRLELSRSDTPIRRPAAATD